MTGALRSLLGLARAPRGRLAAASVLGALTVLFGVGLMGSAGYLISRAAERPAVLSLMVAIVAVMTHGGMGYSREFHVERLLRESLIPRIAPVTPHMILNFIAEKVLGLPKSY
jgi:alkylation response protein AidB-like acyl-CoA dehydrogenase